MIINTARITIRSIRPDDAISLFHYRKDKTANQFQGFIPESVEEVEEFINNTCAEINKPDTWHQVVLIRKDSNELIGDIGINFTKNNHDTVFIGYTLNKHHQNQGFAFEAVKTVIEYVFNTLKKNRVMATITPANTNSIRLVKKLGFSTNNMLDEYGDLTFELHKK